MALFLSGVWYHMRWAVFLWLPMVIAIVIGLLGITVAYPAALALAVGWVLFAVGKEKIIADAYEDPDADPEWVRSVQEEYTKRFEPR